MGWITPREVARRRIITEFELKNGKGRIVVNGKAYTIEKCDDALDLAQLVELLMLKVAGKVLRAKFRPAVTKPAKLRPCKMLGGEYGLGGDCPLPAVTTCDVTGERVPTHYLKVEAAGNVWENWFGRLDELAKCLYIIVREAQGDDYVAKPSVFVGARGAIVTGDVGHA